MDSSPWRNREQSPLPRRLRGLRQERKPGSPRPFVHKVKVTPEQEERLILRAAERRITVVRLLVESALSGGADAAKAKSELAGELFRITRLLGKIGVNINQIARVTNATLEAQQRPMGRSRRSVGCARGSRRSLVTWSAPDDRERAEGQKHARPGAM